MSAEPKVLLEFELAGCPARIVRHYEFGPTAEVWDSGCDSWLQAGPGDGGPDDAALAVYDALEARHARVREAAEAASKALTMAVHALRSYQHFNSSTELAESAADHCEPVLSALRAALEDKAPPLPGTEP